jgi:hypothetical protein
MRGAIREVHNLLRQAAYRIRQHRHHPGRRQRSRRRWCPGRSASHDGRQASLRTSFSARPPTDATATNATTNNSSCGSAYKRAAAAQGTRDERRDQCAAVLGFLGEVLGCLFLLCDLCETLFSTYRWQRRVITRAKYQDDLRCRQM